MIAAQWSWRFVYSNGVQVADIDTWHPTPAYVPSGHRGRIQSAPPRTSSTASGFPRLHYQRQVLPGYTTHFDLTFESDGIYTGECSVLCGEDHSEMHFAVEAVSPTRFREWLAHEGTRLNEASSPKGPGASA